MITIEYKPAVNGAGDWDVLIGGKVSQVEEDLIHKAMEAAIKAD